MQASSWLQSLVNKTHAMLWFFIIACGIARFLCAMCVFEVRASSSPRVTFVPNFVSLAASTAELAHGEKSRTHSLNHLHAQLDARQPKLALWKSVHRSLAPSLITLRILTTYELHASPCLRQRERPYMHYRIDAATAALCWYYGEAIIIIIKQNWL